MSSTVPFPDAARAGGPAGFRARAGRWCRTAMELVVLALVCLSPWAFGAVHPLFEFALYAGIAVLLGLWAVRVLLEGCLTWKQCPVALCLAGMFLLGLGQLVPLPRSVLARLSPATVRTCDEFLPAAAEVLPGGEPRPPVTAPAGHTLSLYPAATRQAAVRLLAVFLLYVVVRSNITAAAALRRLSVVALANGVLLALFGVAQFLTSPHSMLYWRFETAGQVFGPFVCRNHFPFYLNQCIGLGVGLLLSVASFGM